MEFSDDLLDALNEIVCDTKWQLIGTTDVLSKHICTKLFVDTEEDEMGIQPDDVLLICVKGKEYYAMDASCPHEGGPLELGDIEDIDGALSIFCPWHSYDFQLETGKSSMGLLNNVYETKVVDGNVYVKYDLKLSLTKNYCLQKDLERGRTEKINRELPKEDSIVTLSGAARAILSTPDPVEKASTTRETFKKWKTGDIRHVGSDRMPDQPKRKDGLQVLDPGQIKRGKGGTLHSRIALLHSSANIEQWAVDLSWDVIGRFSQFTINEVESLPTEFYGDFAKVADDEAKHFTMLNERLHELGSYFGALPVHNGLWQSADETKDDLLARLAIVHMVHEARGLDVHPKTIQRFEAQGDHESVRLLKQIYEDEITHVACGLKWFTYICERSHPQMDPVTTFHQLVRKHFKGYLKPPFNTNGRSQAGMTEQWYTPLVKM